MIHGVSNKPEMTGRVEKKTSARGERVKLSDATVGVIIPTYNRASLVTQALDSILNQTRPVDDIIVVNDGSTDETEKVLQRYVNRIGYAHQSNSGKSAALNRAISMLDTEYIWILDDDDVALPDALERHLAGLEERPDVDFTYSGCYLFDGEAPPARPDPERLYDALEAPPQMLFIRWLETFPGHTGGMLVPLKCYRAVGPFDTDLTFGQDYEMMLRLVRHFQGVKLVEPTFLLRRHAGPRGPAHERCVSFEREAAWRVYERQTFLKLHRELELNEYLPSRIVSGEELRRRALLQRACVMARHGLFAEAYEDLTGAIAIQTHMPITDEERGICSRMLDLAPVLLRGQGGWLDSVRRLLAAEAAPLFEACVAGLGWSMERQWRHRSYADTPFMMWSLCHLAGISIFPLIARRAWNKRFKDRASLT